LVVTGLAQDAKTKFSRVIAEMGLSGQVVLLGFVRQEELVALYNGADVFVYPSLYEGFGMPVLEAMACGTPTVTSSVGSIPEVAGDAALLVDPNNTEAIAQTILNVVTDDSLRQRMIMRGFERAKRFSWASTAQQVLAVYRTYSGS
jgi:glycosyltransferase involved in cell wall biosynthesis